MSEVVNAPPAATPPAPAAPMPPAPPAPSPAPAAPTPPAAPAPAAPAPASLISRGAGGAPSPAPAPADAPASTIPAKYLVKNEDGSIDADASLVKFAEGHRALEQRLGGGDAPPAKVEDYNLSLPAEVSLDTLKADPLFQGFMKGAHARGMTNAQVSYVIEAYQSRLAMASSPEAGEAELRKEWVTDEQMQRGLANSHRAVAAFAGGEEAMARLDRKFGSDPDFVRLMASIGKELQEDTPVDGALTAVDEGNLQSLMSHPAYFDAKHPEHTKIVAQAKALYAKKTGGK